MSKINNKNKSLILLSIILMYLLMYKTLILNKFLFYEEFITSSFLIIMVGLSVLVLGVRKTKTSSLEKTIFAYVFTYVCIYFSIIYLIGFFNGFLKNSYSLNLESVFMNTICPLFYIICLEIIRFVLLQSNKKDKETCTIITVAIIFFEIFYYSGLYNFTTLDNVLEFLCLLVLKTIVENVLLSYMSRNFGYKVAILYRLTLSIYVYFIPILPDLGTLLNSIFNVVFPFAMWVQLTKLNSEELGRENNVYRPNLLGYRDYFVYGTLVCLFILVSNLFPIKLVSIATGSMSPTIKVGDAVLINGYVNKDNIKKGDVIALRHNDEVVVHRVIEIEEKNNEKIYKTKGDYNNSADSFETRKENIEGVVAIRVPLIGYPALFLTNMKAG